MIRSPRLTGLATVLRLPHHLREPQLGNLLRPQEGSTGSVDAAAATCAVRFARRVLSLLARVPGSPWRNTCLYRSAAECVILREYGAAARLVFGVRRDPGMPAGIAAHAWVALDQAGTPDPVSAQYRPLEHASSWQ